MSILLYGAETWPVTKKDIRKLTTFHMRCLRDTRSHPLALAPKRRCPKGKWGTPDRTPSEAKEATVVWSLAKNARPQGKEEHQVKHS